MKPKIAHKPKRIKTITVTTLTNASQNSDSAKMRVELRFDAKMVMAKIMASIVTGKQIGRAHV